MNSASASVRQKSILAAQVIIALVMVGWSADSWAPVIAVGPNCPAKCNQVCEIDANECAVDVVLTCARQGSGGTGENIEICRSYRGACDSRNRHCKMVCGPQRGECPDEPAPEAEPPSIEGDEDGGGGGGSGSGSEGGSGGGSGGGLGGYDGADGGSEGESGGGSGGESGDGSGGESGDGSGDASGGESGGGSDGGSGGSGGGSSGPPPIPGWPPAGGNIGGGDVGGSVGGDSNSNNMNICVGQGACSIGDPHLRSFDRVYFNFHAIGEFHLARSDEQDIDIQVRYYTGGYTTMSLTKGIAAQVAGQRLTVMLERENLIEVNGEPIRIDSGVGNTLVDESGIAIVRDENVYRIRMPLGISINLKKNKYHLDVEIVSAEHQIEGLAGSNDGIRENDLTVRGGAALPIGHRELSYDQLYREFGDSWRISQDDSLFDYAEGETTATYTDLAYPEKHLDLVDLEPAARARAEKSCRKEGVEPGTELDDCVYDLATTNDSSFIESYTRLADVAATLDAPATAAAGSNVSVNWTGPANHQDFVSIASPAQRADLHKGYSYLDETGMVELRMPGAPGDYELRYIVKVGNQQIASKPISVTEVKATLAAPEKARVDSTINVQWTGPAYYRDRVVFALAERPGSDYRIYAMVSAENDSVELKTPKEPGDYVIRYIIESGNQIIAEVPITIE